jgi:hypothetical protein
MQGVLGAFQQVFNCFYFWLYIHIEAAMEVVSCLLSYVTTRSLIKLCHASTRHSHLSTSGNRSLAVLKQIRRMIDDVDHVQRIGSSNVL